MNEYEKISEDLKEKRRLFHIAQKALIDLIARMHPYGGSCAHTVKVVMRELGFDMTGIIPHSHIEKNIKIFRELAEKEPDKVVILNDTLQPDSRITVHELAQSLANTSAGEYIILALCAKFTKPQKHHMAIVVPGEVSKNLKKCPSIAGGGIDQKYIKEKRKPFTKYIFSTAGWHFTYMDEIVYVKYGKHV